MNKKKIIRPEDFPVEMSEENINILAEMKLMFPDSLCYRDVLPYLDFKDKILISNKVRDIKNIREQGRWNSLSKEEQEEEHRKIDESLNATSNVFRGNILQQELDSINLAKIEEKKKKK